jgi:hypothetical protein
VMIPSRNCTRTSTCRANKLGAQYSSTLVISDDHHSPFHSFTITNHLSAEELQHLCTSPISISAPLPLCTSAQLAPCTSTSAPLHLNSTSTPGALGTSEPQNLGTSAPLPLHLLCTSLCITFAPPLNHLWTCTSTPPLHHLCTNFAPPLHLHLCTSAHLHCCTTTTATAPLQLLCTTYSPAWHLHNHTITCTMHNHCCKRALACLHILERASIGSMPLSKKTCTKQQNHA